MDHYQALFEPDLKAGGYVVTFPDFGLDSGLKKAELARRIGMAKTHVDRLFSLRHLSRLNHIEAALAALGKRLHVEACDAA